MHAALCRAGDGLFDIAVLHLLGFYEQGVMGTVDEGGEIAARVNGADNQIGIVKLRCRAVPVSVKNVDDCLYVTRVGIDDVIFAVAEAAAATAAAKGRAGEVRGHDEGRVGVDDHACFVRQWKAGAGLLGLHPRSFQLLEGARGRASSEGLRLKHYAHVYATVGVLFKSPYHVAVRQEVDLQPHGFLRRANGISDDVLASVRFDEDPYAMYA